MTKRLTGAALYAKVTRALKAELAEEYGLPMSEYTSRMGDPYSLGSDMQPVLEITFTRKTTGAAIKITAIHTDDDGLIDQYGTNYGYMSY